MIKSVYRERGWRKSLHDDEEVREKSCMGIIWRRYRGGDNISFMLESFSKMYFNFDQIFLKNIACGSMMCARV